MKDNRFSRAVMLSILVHGIILGLLWMYRFPLHTGAASSEIDFYMPSGPGTGPAYDAQAPLQPQQQEQSTSNQTVVSNQVDTTTPSDEAIKAAEQSSQSAQKQASAQNQKSSMASPAPGSLSKFVSRLKNQQRGDSPFEMSGEVLNRKVLYRKIPVYPDGVEKTAFITLQFEVLPDGRVGQIYILKRTDPILEKISIEALKQWRFSTILGSEKQSGQITFKYEIQ